MPNNIDRIHNGLSAAGLAGIKEDVSTAELHALLEANWAAVADGRAVTDVEAAWLIKLANHPSADRALRVAIASRLETAGLKVSDGAKSAGFLLDAAAWRALGDSYRQPANPLASVTAPWQPVASGLQAPVQPWVGFVKPKPVQVEKVVDYAGAIPESGYEINLAAANEIFGRSNQAVSVEDLFTTVVGGNKVPTHYDPKSGIRLIMYNNALGPQQKDLIRFVKPGEVHIAIKHHSPSHPKLVGNDKEAIKFQVTHIGIVVGVEVEVDGKMVPGVITLNNPQPYEDGLFGSPDYPLILTRLTFPKELSPKEVRDYVDNIRTWMVIANTFTEFPGDYNGGDPLGTLSPEKVKIVGDMLLQALVGTPEERAAAMAWFDDPANLVYCAELGHLGVNLGVHYPLNKATLGERFAAVRDALKSKNFLAHNSNKKAELVQLQMAPESLKPMPERLGMQLKPGIPEGQPFGEGLALRPMTMADMLEQFVKGHVVRDHGPDAVLTDAEAKALAQAQGQLLRGSYEGLLEAMSLNKQPGEDDARIAARAGVEALFNQIVAVVETPFKRYADFRAALAGPLEKARMASGPRPDGSGAFMPPHAWLLTALGRWPAVKGPEAHNTKPLLGLEVVGQAMHESVLTPKAPEALSLCYWPADS